MSALICQTSIGRADAFPVESDTIMFGLVVSQAAREAGISTLLVACCLRCL